MKKDNEIIYTFPGNESKDSTMLLNLLLTILCGKTSITELLNEIHSTSFPEEIAKDVFNRATALYAIEELLQFLNKVEESPKSEYPEVFMWLYITKDILIPPLQESLLKLKGDQDDLINKYKVKESE